MDFKILVFTVFICGASAFRNAFDTDLYESVIDDVKCTEQLDYLGDNSLGLRFLDASAKIPTGILSGNTNDLGDYYQCLDIDQIEADMEFKGKYCTVIMPYNQMPIQIPEWPEIPDLNITLPENITWPKVSDIPFPTFDNQAMVDLKQMAKLQEITVSLAGVGQTGQELVNTNNSRVFPLLTAQFGSTLAFCIPKVCQTRQAVDFIQRRLIFLNFTFVESYCRLPNDKPLAPADYTAFAIFGFIGILLIISTAYDLLCVFYLDKDPNPMFCCFSIYTNTRRFLTFNSAPGALECVDGVRAISMAWVIVGHTYAMTLLGFVHNAPDTLAWLRQFTSTWVNSAPITVDTFFLLSGILVVYTTVGKISRGRFIRSIHLFYINRLLRMFPLLAAVVLLQASVLNHVSDGPFWRNSALAVENCRRYWWSALLHVQNYFHTEMCLAHTWYLSVDTQLYFVCPLILVWMFSSKRFAWIAVTCGLLLSLVSSSVYSYMYNFSAALIHPGRISEFNDYIRVYYINTLTRAPPFFVGMIYGYMLHLWRDKKIRISKINVFVLWVLSFAMMAFCIFSIYPVMQLDHDVQSFDNFLNAYMRAIWACGLGWLIFACVKGYGGPINWVLSLRMWKLPARMSFAMYLIHLPLIMVANGSWVKTHYLNNGETMYRFMSDFTLTFLAAFVLCITIDAPFSTIQKILLGGSKKRPPRKAESKQAIVDNGSFKTSL